MSGSFLGQFAFCDARLPIPNNLEGASMDQECKSGTNSKKVEVVIEFANPSNAVNFHMNTDPSKPSLF